MQCFFRSSNVDGRKEEEKHEKDYEKSIKKPELLHTEGRKKRFLLFSLFRICKSQRCTRCSQFNDDDLCEKIHNKDLSRSLMKKGLKILVGAGLGGGDVRVGSF